MTTSRSSQLHMYGFSDVVNLLGSPPDTVSPGKHKSW